MCLLVYKIFTLERSSAVHCASIFFGKGLVVIMNFEMKGKFMISLR